MSIKTLDELRPAVRAMENTLTIKGITDYLRANNCVDWAAVKREARDRGIGDPESLDKNLFRTLVSWASSPEARKRGGDRHSAAFRAKTARANDVRAVIVTDFDKDIDAATVTEKTVAIDDSSNPGIDYKSVSFYTPFFLSAFSPSRRWRGINAGGRSKRRQRKAV